MHRPIYSEAAFASSDPAASKVERADRTWRTRSCPRRTSHRASPVLPLSPEDDQVYQDEWARFKAGVSWELIPDLLLQRANGDPANGLREARWQVAADFVVGVTS